MILFTAQKDYPEETLEESVKDIRAGEQCEAVKEGDEYIVYNLDTSHHWVRMSSEEFEKIKG